MKKTLFYTAFFLSFFISAQSANAQSSTHIIVVPPKQEIEIKKDAPSTDARVRFYNESSMPIIGQLSVVDFVVENDQGAPQFIETTQNTKQNNRYSAAEWIILPYTRATIAPKDHVDVIFKLKVPTNALPGGHYAAIIFEPITGEGQTNGKLDAATSISPRVASLFTITVPGAFTEQATVSKLEVPSFLEYGPVSVTARVKNIGDIHIKAKPFVRISDWTGSAVSTQVLKNVNVFPMSEREFKADLGDKIMLGRYKVVFTAAYGSGKALEQFAYVWIIPWKLITITLLAAIIIIVLIQEVLKNKAKKVEQLEKKLAQEEKEIAKLKETIEKRND